MANICKTSLSKEDDNSLNDEKLYTKKVHAWLVENAFQYKNLYGFHTSTISMASLKWNIHIAIGIDPKYLIHFSIDCIINKHVKLANKLTSSFMLRLNNIYTITSDTWIWLEYSFLSHI